MVFDNQIYVSELYGKIYDKLNNNISKNRLLLKNCLDNIENKSPLNILRKGYSLVYDSKGKILDSTDGIKTDDEINIRLNKGNIKARVTEAGE